MISGGPAFGGQPPPLSSVPRFFLSRGGCGPQNRLVRVFVLSWGLFSQSSSPTFHFSLPAEYYRAPPPLPLLSSSSTPLFPPCMSWFSAHQRRWFLNQVHSHTHAGTRPDRGPRLVLISAPPQPLAEQSFPPFPPPPALASLIVKQHKR